MEKKGSHVGVITSFGIFVIFVLFFFSMIQPNIKQDRELRNTLDLLEKRIMERINKEVGYLSVKVVDNGQGGNTCNLTIKDLEYDSNFKIIVKNESGGIVSGEAGRGSEININADDDSFYKIYFAEDFVENDALSGTDCVVGGVGVTTAPINYTLGQYYTEIVPFKTELEELIRFYDADYSILVGELINYRAGMHIEFEDRLGVLKPKSPKEIPVEANVYSKNIPIEYFDEKGNFIKAELRIKVW